MIFAAALVLAVALGGTLILVTRHMSRAEAMTVAAELMDRSIADVRLRTEGFIAPIDRAVAVSPAWHAVEALPNKNGHPARDYLAALAVELPQVTSILLAYDSGDIYLIGMTRQRPPEQLRRMRAPADAVFIEWFILRAGRSKEIYIERMLGADLEVLTTKTTIGDDFDPRTRPWFEAAHATDGVAVSEVYRFAGSGRLGLSVSRRHANGVVAIDMTLDDVQQQLRAMPEAEQGTVAIYGQGGEIVVQSNATPPEVGVQEALETPGDPTEQIVARLVAGTMPADGIIEIDGGRWIVRTTALDLGGDGDGGQTLMAAMPVATITAPMEARSRLTVIISLLIVAASVPLLWLLARRLSRPLIELAGEAKAVRDFDLAVPAAAPSRVTEIRQLEAAMAQMRSNLRMFALYVPKALVKQLLLEEQTPALGGVRRDITVLFMDLENFTAMAADLPPEEVMARMSRYFEVVTQTLIAHEATIDKYIGDAVMAFWNAPLDTPDHVAKACRAALAVIEAASAETSTWSNAGPAIRTRIGLHCGEAIVGNVGSSDRMNYTALGATVNLASRLETMNREIGTEILVSAAIVERIGDRFLVERVGTTALKGFAEPVEVFALNGTASNEGPNNPSGADRIPMPARR